MRFVFLVLLPLCACRAEVPPSPATTPPQPATEPLSRRQAASSEREGCVPLVESDVVAQTYAQGVAKLEASKDGEHYLAEPFEAGVDALKIAAQNGHMEAQSLYGRTVFGARFTAQAPTAAEREDYVGAIAFLRVAAKAGDADAAAYMPGLTGGPDPLEAPLDSLPEGWVAEAFARADAWVDCYGLPQP